MATKRFDDAIKFLYEQLRSNFNNPRAHINYFWVIALHGSKSQILAPPELVDHGCSVLLENSTTNTHRWVTIESAAPLAGRNEFDESSPIVAAILGKRKNDLIEVPGRFIQPQQERLLEIQTKYVRLFQDVSDEFQNRFPGETFMQTMSLGSGDNFDPSPLIKTLEDRRSFAERTMQLYRDEQVCSSHFLASRLGIDQRQLMKGLMADESLEIRCVNVEPRQLEDQAKEYFGRRCCVLDISAIVTISELDSWDLLDSKSEYLVSRTTLELISRWIEDLSQAQESDRGLAYVTDKSQLVIHTITEEETKRSRDELQAIHDIVKTRCIIETSTRIAELAPDRRDLYNDFFGYHTLEAICIAKDKGAVLWTDDFVVGSVGRIEFSVDRTWTQLQLKIAMNKELINEDYFEQASAKLVAWKYVNTMWSGRTLLSAGQISNWNINDWPFKQCLEVFGAVPLVLLNKAGITYEFITRVRPSLTGSTKYAEIVLKMLDLLNSRLAVRWMLALRAHEVVSNSNLDNELALYLQIWLHTR